VRKAAIILLTSLYLLGATEAYQLLKLPFLFEHYKTHQKYTQGLTFTKFINNHYFSTAINYNSDYQQDMQLPFKSSNRAVSLLNFDSFFMAKQSIVSIMSFNLRIKHLLFDDKDYASNKLNNIFQPPRALLFF
jgi:hypothetical protein